MAVLKKVAIVFLPNVEVSGGEATRRSEHRLVLHSLGQIWRDCLHNLF